MPTMQYYSAMKKKKRKFSRFACKNILNGKKYIKYRTVA